MEVKKVFALASVTVLTGFVATATSAGCSSTTEVVEQGETGPEGGKPKTPPDGGTSEPDPEEETVGKLCKTDADCEIAGGGPSVGDNRCSIGFFTIGDLYGDPVCVSTCTRGPGMTFADILCDGNAPETARGVCNAPNPGEMGVCLPLCEFDATKVVTNCEGSNKCTAAYFGSLQSGEVFSLGICLGACKVDADCKGTPGDSKCQAEIGLCVSNKEYIAYTAKLGDGCVGDANPETCSCNTIGGTGPNAKIGYCGHTCITGADGDAACGALKTGWKCSAGLPTKFNDGKPAFATQPDGIIGGCALPCTVDNDCDEIAAALTQAGAKDPVTVKCEDAAGFKVCVAPSK